MKNMSDVLLSSIFQYFSANEEKPSDIDGFKQIIKINKLFAIKVSCTSALEKDLTYIIPIGPQGKNRF